MYHAWMRHKPAMLYSVMLEERYCNLYEVIDGYILIMAKFLCMKIVQGEKTGIKNVIYMYTETMIT